MDAPPVSAQRVTQLLTEWSHGENAALAELTPLVYEDLRRVAHHYMTGQRPDHTLQTTALVNEAYLRLADQTHPSWQTRVHFFAVAARAMRQILVDYAKSYRAQKRGGGALKVELDEVALVSPAQSKEIVDLNEALEGLAAIDSRKAEVVELKYFGGLRYRWERGGAGLSPSPRGVIGNSPNPGYTRNCITPIKRLPVQFYSRPQMNAGLRGWERI